MTFRTITMEFAGQVGVEPRIGRMFTDNIYSEIIAPGYIKQGDSGYNYSITDMIAVSYSDGNNGVSHSLFVVTISGNIITLEDLTESGGLTPPLNLIGQKNVLLQGTLAVTNGSVNVVGTGTNFLSLTKFQVIWINDSVYYVDTVTSDTVMTFTGTYGGTTAAGLSAYTDDNYITCTDSSGEIVFQVGPNGEITTPLVVNNYLKGAYHPVRTTTSSTVPRFDDANGIIRMNNSIAAVITFSAANVRYKVGYEVEIIQIGSNLTTFATSGGDTVLYNTMDGLAPTITAGSVVRARLVEVVDSVGSWSVEVSGGASEIYINPTQALGAGPWAATDTTILRMTRRDNVVNMTLVGVTNPIQNATSSNGITATAAVPVQFRPTETIDGYARVQKGTDGEGIGSIRVAFDTGSIIIGCNEDGTSSWAGSAGVTPVGFNTVSFSWVVAPDL